MQGVPSYQARAKDARIPASLLFDKIFEQPPNRGMSESIDVLTAEIRAFRDARDWMQFHAPKELAVAIAAEAGELLQHFVWQTPEQSEQRAKERRDEISGEIADVAILLFELADNLDINLAEAMRTKLARNELRYPVEKARGSNRKYDEL